MLDHVENCHLITYNESKHHGIYLKYMKLFNKTVFEFADYKLYLNALIKSKVQNISELARAAQCQRSHVSRVIRGNIQLTLDQGFALAAFLKMNSNEAEYFKVLVEIQRSSTYEYRQYLNTQAAKMRQNFLDLKNHVQNQTIITSKPTSGFEQSNYFRSWLFAAIHTAVSIPSLQSPGAMARRFRLTETEIISTLKQLSEMGFVEFQNGVWSWKRGDQHLAREHFLANTHHINWSHKALDSIYRGQGNDLHYSVVQSLSVEDFENLKLKITDWIRVFGQIAGPSNPEELVCLRLDYFKV
jgi:uncharacterized protein (TIGR02147 family)